MPSPGQRRGPALAHPGPGGAIGLLLGGALTRYRSWRWTLNVNLIFAGVAFTGGAVLLKRQASLAKPRLDIPGALLVSGAVFCLVYGFSNAATHSWHAPSTWGFLAAGVALGAGFAVWQGRTAHPLLPRSGGPPASSRSAPSSPEPCSAADRCAR